MAFTPTIVNSTTGVDTRKGGDTCGNLTTARRKLEELMLEAGLVRTDKFLVAGRLDAQSAQLSTIQSYHRHFSAKSLRRKKICKTPVATASPVPIMEKIRSARSIR